MNAKRQALVLGLAILFSLVPMVLPDTARSEIKLVSGQTVYVPAYSFIFYGDRQRPFDLTVTLSIRNTDLTHSITLLSIEYYNSDGKPVKKYLDSPTKLEPLAAKHSIIEESDKSGGVGASFIVKWKSDAKVTEPLIETVMISTVSQQGLSFTSRGRAIEEK